MKLLTTITSNKENYTANIIEDDSNRRNMQPAIFFFGDMDIDVDGSPFWKNDPCGQNETSLHFNGKPIDSSVVPGIVLPPEVIKLEKGAVLGCQAEVEFEGYVQPAVVFDIGPHNKLGEGSYALAQKLAIPAQKNGNGGVDTQNVLYRFWPGVPAQVQLTTGETVTFTLQPFGS